MNTDKTPSASDTMIAYLAVKGKKSRKAGTATTEELATVIGKSIKYTYDRLWWLAKKDSKLLMVGTGKSAVWRSMPKVRKVKAAPESAAVAE